MIVNSVLKIVDSTRSMICTMIIILLNSRLNNNKYFHLMMITLFIIFSIMIYIEMNQNNLKED